MTRETGVRDHTSQSPFELAYVRANSLRDEERDLLGQHGAGELRLRHQDRDTGLELRRLDGDCQAPTEARLQALLETIDFLRITVAGEDDLVLSLEQLVEGVEKLFLRALLAGEELNVVDEQCVERAVRGLELVDRVVLQGSHHVTDKAFRMHVGNTCFVIALLDEMRDRVHQMRLTEPYTAVEEQRVV